MTPAEMLLAAADKVQFEGWCQGIHATATDGRAVHPHSPDAKKWCAAGALIAGEMKTFSESGSALEALANHIHTSIAFWNDQPGRTVGEVADTMRRVAKELLERGRRMILSALLIAVLSYLLVLGTLWLTLRLTMPGEEKILTDAFRRRQP